MDRQRGHHSAEPACVTQEPVAIGVIGIGVMGRPMARHLRQRLPTGSQVVVTGPDRSRAAELEEIGVRWADTPAQLASEVEVIVYMVPDIPQVRSTLEGADGVLAGRVGPLTLVIASSTSPEAVRELGDSLHPATAGTTAPVRVVDAPVSGGQEGAEAGQLSIMVGGDDQDVAQVMGVLAAMGTPVHLGPLGSGQVAKACNQVIVAAELVALAEAALIAERAGLDVLDMFTLLQGSYAGSRLMEVKKRRFAEHDHSPSGPAKFMIKDLGAALAEADATGTRTPVTSLLLEIFTGVTAAGLGDLDTTVVQRYLSDEVTG